MYSVQDQNNVTGVNYTPICQWYKGMLYTIYLTTMQIQCKISTNCKPEERDKYSKTTGYNTRGASILTTDL